MYMLWSSLLLLYDRPSKYSEIDLLFDPFMISISISKIYPRSDVFCPQSGGCG